jgi:hypothetical protein
MPEYPASEPSDRQTAGESCIGKPDSPPKGSPEDRQTTDRRPADTVRSRLRYEQPSMFSDGSTVRPDDDGGETDSDESRIGKPNGDISDGTDGTDALYPPHALSSEGEVFALAHEVLGLPEPEPSPPEFVVAARERRARKGAEAGLTAKWSRMFGYISLHDPTTGERHDLAMQDAPAWSKWEARKRKALCKDGDRYAYGLTSAQMEEIWELEHPAEPDLIVEEHPLPE